MTPRSEALVSRIAEGVGIVAALVVLAALKAVGIDVEDEPTETERHEVQS